MSRLFHMMERGDLAAEEDDVSRTEYCLRALAFS